MRTTKVLGYFCIAALIAGLGASALIAQDREDAGVGSFSAGIYLVCEDADSDWLSCVPLLIDDSENRIGEMTESVEAVSELAEESREEGEDVTRIRCIEEQLTSMNGFVRVAEESLEEIRGTDRGDRSTIEHQYNLVTISDQRVRNLYAQARQCAGEVLLYTGDTIRDSDYDGTLPEWDPTDPGDWVGFDGIIVLDRIPDRSPSI